MRVTVVSLADLYFKLKPLEYYTLISALITQ